MSEVIPPSTLAAKALKLASFEADWSTFEKVTNTANTSAANTVSTHEHRS